MDAGAGLSWHKFSINALPDDLQRAFNELAKAHSKAEDAHQELKDAFGQRYLVSQSESDKRKYLEIISQLEWERLENDPVPIEETAKDAFMFWETMKYQTGLDIRGALRRRALIPFVLFPRHVSARSNKSASPSVFQSLRQAHDAFVFGAPAAGLALMRSVMEMALRDHYGASGASLDELIDSVAGRLPRRANTAALHRLRRLANRVLHGESSAPRQLEKAKREFELEIVSLLFVLRALIESAPP